MCIRDRYSSVIKDLVEADQPESILRGFEANLLAELGHAINYYDDYRTGDELATMEHYFFHPRVGFSTLAIGEGEVKVSAAEIEALRHNDMSEQVSARLVKNIHARTLAFLMGEKSLNSKELYRSVQKLHVKT